MLCTAILYVILCVFAFDIYTEGHKTSKSPCLIQWNPNLINFKIVNNPNLDNILATTIFLLPVIKFASKQSILAFSGFWKTPIYSINGHFQRIDMYCKPKFSTFRQPHTAERHQDFIPEKMTTYILVHESKNDEKLIKIYC